MCPGMKGLSVVSHQNVLGAATGLEADIKHRTHLRLASDPRPNVVDVGANIEYTTAVGRVFLQPFAKQRESVGVELREIRDSTGEDGRKPGVDLSTCWVVPRLLSGVPPPMRH